jgi:hypothetical protein
MDLKNKSISDLTYQLVPFYNQKAASKTVSDLCKDNRFTKISTVSQRDFHEIEQYFYDFLDDVPFVELSPLQPLGINTVLAGVDSKKAIDTIRGMEVLSDATTALFLAAYMNYSVKNIVRVATHTRTTRYQTFPIGSNFLPHFKVFAEVSIGTQNQHFGEKEVHYIAQHLLDELQILTNIYEKENHLIESFDVNIGNLCFSRDLLSQYNNEQISIHLRQSFDYLAKRLNLPEKIPIDEHLMQELKQYSFNKGFKILKIFLDYFEKFRIEKPYINYYLDLARSSGINYYRHIVYEIIGFLKDGKRLFLADGGSNDWGIKMSGNKQLFTVSSGIGTELLIQNCLTAR